MKTDALDIDADGMPLFRPDPAAAPSRIDVTTALRLEQETLRLQDLEASLMEQQDQLRLLQFEQLRRDIQDGLASGEAEAWNPKAIKAEGRRRLGARTDSRLGV